MHGWLAPVGDGFDWSQLMCGEVVNSVIYKSGTPDGDDDKQYMLVEATWKPFDIDRMPLNRLDLTDGTVLNIKFVKMIGKTIPKIFSV